MEDRRKSVSYFCKLFPPSRIFEILYQRIFPKSGAFKTPRGFYSWAFITRKSASRRPSRWRQLRAQQHVRSHFGGNILQYDHLRL